jgi:hypothetical protein
VNLQSEIAYFSELRTLDKARFLAELVHEIVGEARATFEPGSDRSFDVPRVRSAVEFAYRMTHLIDQVLVDDASRPDDAAIVRSLLVMSNDPAGERMVHSAYRRVVRAFDRHDTTSF